MSHMVESMAYTGQMPWHTLGARVDTGVTPDEMLQAAGLNWTIRREPLYAKVDGREIKVPGRRALIRSSDDKVMTIAGQDWKPFQNKDLLAFFQDYSTAGGASLETAGSLRGGSVVWALANLNDGFTVGSKSSRDRVNGYLLFTSPHKVGAAITIRTTTVRVVCANTMAMAERGGTVNYSQSHTSKFNVAAAREAVEGAHKSLALASGRANTLAKLKLSLGDTLQVLAPHVGAPDDLTLDELMALANDGKSRLGDVMASVQSAPGALPDTGWGVLNGVTHWADHAAGRANDSRMFRSWVGDTGRTKLAVEASLLALV
jgi:phage/plasmid-like protein (TIGR03299 family)